SSTLRFVASASCSPALFSLFCSLLFFFFFFNDTATTEIYTLSLHDALPIFARAFGAPAAVGNLLDRILDERLDLLGGVGAALGKDRKSTRLNSSHLVISYAVFCLKKKKNSKENHSPI